MAKKNRPTLSLVMIARNESLNLPRSLGSVKGIVDQMIVVDTGSDDDTKSIACQMGAIVIESPWEDDFSKPRNAGIEEAAGDWILQLDADEELVSGADTLKDILRDRHKWVYRVKGLCAPDTDSLANNKEQVWVPRLFRRLPDIRYRFPIHEHILCPDRERYADSALVINHFGPYIKSHAGRSERNLRLLEKAVAQYPGHVEFRFYTGMEYLAGSQWAAALPYFLETVAEPQSIGSLVISAAERNIIWCLFQLGRLEEGWNHLKSAQKRYPDFTDLFYIEAQYLVRQGRNADAAAVLRHCLDLGDPPADFWSWGGTGSWRAADHLRALSLV